ncbi:DUF5455 family protein [Chitinimonas naiadis]
MPFLALFLEGVFGALVAAFANWLGKRAAVFVAAMTVFLAALAALWVAIRGLIAGLMVVIPNSGLTHWLLVGLNLVLPANWEVCCSAMVAADLAVYLYRWNMAHVLQPTV